MSDETTAGPEMDARVATLVLGATYEPRFPGDVAGYYVLPPDGHYTTRCISEELPGYSSSMDAAMDVIAHMRRQGWAWHMYDHAIGWTVYLGHADYTDSPVGNVSPEHPNGHASLAEGICVAALKAVREAKKEKGAAS